MAIFNSYVKLPEGKSIQPTENMGIWYKKTSDDPVMGVGGCTNFGHLKKGRQMGTLIHQTMNGFS